MIVMSWRETEKLGQRKGLEKLKSVRNVGKLEMLEMLVGNVGNYYKV